MKKVFIVALTALIIGCGTIIYVSKPVNNTIKTYSSLKEAVNGISFDIRVPKIIATEDNLICESIAGQLISIHNENMELKASSIDNNKVDIGGYYEDYRIDKRYKGTGDIEEIRIRTNSDSIDRMYDTIITYRYNKVSYSLRIKSELNLDKIAEILSTNRLEEIEENIEDESEDASAEISTEETEKYTIYTIRSLTARISIPNTVVKANLVEGTRDGIAYCTFIIGNKPIMILEKQNFEDSNDSIETVQIEEGYTLRFYKDNLFSKGTQEFDSYDDILNSIKYIESSIESIDNK